MQARGLGMNKSTRMTAGICPGTPAPAVKPDRVHDEAMPGPRDTAVASRLATIDSGTAH
jgi:hypothetical protein